MIEQIRIEQLKVKAHVGVPAEERVEPQRLILNVVCWPPATELHDELAGTINYSTVAKAVKEIVRRRHYKLIETLAEEIGAELFGRFQLRKVAVEVRKFVLPDAEYVSVTAIREGKER